MKYVQFIKFYEMLLDLAKNYSTLMKILDETYNFN